MEFNKNTEINTNICYIAIKSVGNIVDMSTFTPIYSTLSKIGFTDKLTFTKSGTLYTRKLTAFYPGLSSEDFTKMHQLTLSTFQIMVKLQNNDVYEIASLQFPMEIKPSYNIASGHSLLFISKCPLPVKYRGNQTAAGITFTGFNYDFNFYLG